MKHCIFLYLLHKDRSALRYITSYNKLYNGFFKTLLPIYRRRSWTASNSNLSPHL